MKATIGRPYSWVLYFAGVNAPTDNQDGPQTYKNHDFFRRRRGIKVASLILLSLALFVAGLLAWSSRYSLVRADLAGIPVHNGASAQTLSQQLRQKTQTYSIMVSSQGVTKKYSLNDAGISVKVDDSVSSALRTKKPHNILARLAFWHRAHIPLNLTVDQAVLDKFIADKLTITIQKSKNAAIGVKNGRVVVSKEQSGQAYTTSDNAQTTLLAHISNLQNTPIMLSRQSIEPAIISANLETARQKVAGILSQKVSFKVVGSVIAARPAEIGEWLELTPVPKEKTVDVTVNSGKVLSYLNQIAGPYIQPPTSAIVSSVGGVSQVLVPGQNGVDIVNKNSVAADVAKKIMDGQTVSVSLPIRYAAYKTVVAQPHDKWLVVDVTTKRMYAYQKNTLVRTFLISAGAPLTPTVLGQFHIYSKFVSQDMRGNNVDGSRYYQPDVPYVNYFYGAYAIHGNYWRPSWYFGNVNSSHGCVGIMDGDAAWVYNWAPIGTTVIVHA